MRTIDISPSEMARRVARYAELAPLEVQKNTNLPQEAADIVWARKLLSVVGLEKDADTPINSAAPSCAMNIALIRKATAKAKIW